MVRSNEVSSILVLCMPGIGDSLFAVPALRAFKRVFPRARLDVLTMFRGAAELLACYPEVDNVVHWDFVRETRLRSLRFALDLRRRRYDVCMLPYPANRLEYNVISVLTGARVRMGHRYNHLDFACGNWLNTVSVREEDSLTNIEENLRLVEAFTGVRSDDNVVTVPLKAEHRQWALECVEESGLKGETLVGFHPGGSVPKNHIHKRWPPEHFAELGRILHRRLRVSILTVGGPDEADLLNRIAESIGGAAKAVQTPTLLHTCALIERCRHFVSNDSALLHLARALDVESTGIFGPTNARWVRMPGHECREVTLGLPCQPCFYYSPRHLKCREGDFRCLRDLTPETVAEQVLCIMDKEARV